MRRLVVLLVFLDIILLPNVLADEVWDTDEGRVIYLDDVRDTAVWETENLDGILRFYIPGLAGNIDQRAVHDGFWIQYAGQGCGSTLVGADGHSGKNWGRLKLIFHSNGFPSNWTLLLGSCFDEPDSVIRGQSPLLDQ